jgi:hypothetical protein
MKTNTSNIQNILYNINTFPDKFIANENVKHTIDGTIVEINNSMVSTISPYAFYYCDRLTTISFPNCITIGSNAFNSCYSLTTVSFPKCTTIDVSAF